MAKNKGGNVTKHAGNQVSLLQILLTRISISMPPPHPHLRASYREVFAFHPTFVLSYYYLVLYCARELGQYYLKILSKYHDIHTFKVMPSFCRPFQIHKNLHLAALYFVFSFGINAGL